MDRVRIALIGSGNMGRQYGEMIVNGKVPHMTLTAVTARNEDAKAWAATLPGVKAFDSTGALFEAPELYDAVLVVTPHPAHYEIVMKAFSLGKHVFCDKPASQSLKNAREMEETAKEKGLEYGIMFHQRLYAKHVKVKEILDSGVLGELLRVHIENTEAYRTIAYHRSCPWRSSWEKEGGGALINQGQHPLDIYAWLFGMPQSLYASVHFGKYNDFLVDDEDMIVMQYENGFSGSFFITTGEAQNTERMTVAGTKGTLLMDGETVTLTLHEDSREYARTHTCTNRVEMKFESPMVFQCPTVKPYDRMLENFACHLLFQEPLVAPGKDSTHALELAAAAYLSGWKKQVVTLPVDSDAYEAALKDMIQQEKSRK